MKHLLLLSCLWIHIGSEYTTYDGYKAFEVYPENQQQLEFLTYFAQKHDYDIWSLSQVPGSPFTIMVAPGAEIRFVKVLNETNISYSVLIEDLGSYLRDERSSSLQNHIQNEDGTISFANYHRYEIIMDYLLELSQTYPDIVSLTTPGITHEGRKVQPIKIGTRGENKPIILIDGGIHAREWISPAVVLYLIKQLVEEKSNRHMIENVDWYIIPLLNPDGYEYTHTKDRLWRKNRSPNSPNQKCLGVDLNRNFDIFWTSQGSYGKPCNEQYSGKSPFDQSETQFLRDFVQQYSANIKLYITVHSFGEMILYPWGYTRKLPANVQDLRELGEKVKNAIANKSGTKYTVHSISHHPKIGLTYGSSVDWVKAVGGVNLTYAIELPGEGHQFLLPPCKIKNVSIETFEAFKTFHYYIQKEFGKI